MAEIKVDPFYHDAYRRIVEGRPVDAAAWRANTALAEGQTRRHSLLEACINIVIGFSINYFANLLIFPLFGWQLSHAVNFELGVIYTGISLVRSYVLRRWFNGFMLRQLEKL